MRRRSQGLNVDIYKPSIKIPISTWKGKTIGYGLRSARGRETHLQMWSLAFFGRRFCTSWSKLWLRLVSFRPCQSPTSQDFTLLNLTVRSTCSDPHGVMISAYAYRQRPRASWKVMRCWRWVWHWTFAGSMVWLPISKRARQKSCYPFEDLEVLAFDVNTMALNEDANYKLWASIAAMKSMLQVNIDISEDCFMSVETSRRRSAEGWLRHTRPLGQHRRILYQNAHITLNKRSHLFQTIVLSQLTYGMESWVVDDVRTKAYIHSGIMRLYRRLLKLSPDSTVTDRAVCVALNLPGAQYASTPVQIEIPWGTLQVGAYGVMGKHSCWRTMVHLDSWRYPMVMEAAVQQQQPHEPTGGPSPIGSTSCCVFLVIGRDWLSEVYYMSLVSNVMLLRCMLRTQRSSATSRPSEP